VGAESKKQRAFSFCFLLGALKSALAKRPPNTALLIAICSPAEQ
jgi:hypothetical protein